MTEDEVRVLLSILHDLFPVRTMRVVTSLTERDVEEFGKSLDRMIPLLKQMLKDRIGEPIPYAK